MACVTTTSETYKYVLKHEYSNGVVKWEARYYVKFDNEIEGYKKSAIVSAGQHDTEKEAAVAVDMKLIRYGREPINVLKRKA